MRWQDFVFTSGSFFLVVTLYPMLRAATKPPLHSSVPIAVILFVFAATYLTLGFVLAPAIEFVQACAWAWLAVQRWSTTRLARTCRRMERARLASRRGEPLADSAVDLGSSPSAST